MKVKNHIARVNARKPICLVLVFIIMQMYCSALPATTMASEPKYFRMEKITIAGANGTELPAHIYTPVTAAPKDGFPAVIFIHSWMLNQWEYETQMIKLAKKGYITLSYDCRGWGLAGGNIGTAGTLEMKDLNNVVDWLLANRPVDPQNIGSIGVSYGGGQSLLALNFEPRIKTVVAMSCWADLSEGLAPDDSGKVFWSSFLCGTAAFRAEPEMFNWLDSYLRGVNLEPTRAAFKMRSAQTYLDNINSRETVPPIFIVNGMNDDLFTTRQIVNFYEGYHGIKKLMLANGIHASAELPGLLGVSSDIWDDTMDWFDYWLKGENTGILDKPRFSIYQKWTRSQEAFADWPLPTNNLPLYPSANGLSRLPGEENTADIANAVSAASSGIPALSPFLDTLNIPWKGATSEQLNSKGSLCFDSDALDQPVTVIGTPWIHALVKPDDQSYQLNFMIYDVNQAGTASLVAHSPITIREGVADQEKVIDLRMNVVSYRFESGHRIRLVVSSQDPAFVLPLPNSFAVNLTMGGRSNTSLNMPVLP